MDAIRDLAAAVLLLASSAATGHAVGQPPSAARGRSIVIEMVTKNGGASFAFQPADVNAQPADTLHFVDEADMPHNVHFKTHPPGARIGDIAVGPYVTAKGQTYDIVINSRFTPGRYEFVCDPHEALGMRGVLTVTGAPNPSE
jgi:plastocyanin